MANKYLNLPNNLAECDVKTLEDFKRGTEEVFVFDLFGEGKNRDLTEPYTSFDGKYHWSTNKDFFVYITDLTETSDIRSANKVLYETISTAPEYKEVTMAGAPDSSAQGNMPGKIRLEEWQEAEAARQEHLAERGKSDSVIRQAINKKIENQTKLDEANKAKEEKEAKTQAQPKPQQKSKIEPLGNTPHVTVSGVFNIPETKVEKPKGETVLVIPTKPLPTVNLTDAQKNIVWAYALAAATDPGTTQVEVANIMRNSIPESLRKTIPEQVIQSTARDFVERSKNIAAAYKSAHEIPITTTMNSASPVSALFGTEQGQLVALALAANRDTKATLTAPLLGGDSTLTEFYFGSETLTPFERVEEGKEEEYRDKGFSLNLSDVDKIGKGTKDFLKNAQGGEVSGAGVTYAPRGYSPIYVPSTDAKVVTKTKELLGSIGGFPNQGAYANYLRDVSRGATTLTEVSPYAAATVSGVTGAVVGEEIANVAASVTAAELAQVSTGSVASTFALMAGTETELLVAGETASALAVGGFGTTALASLAVEGQVLYFAGVGNYSFNIVGLTQGSTQLYAAGINFGNKAFGIGVTKVGGKVVGTGLITKTAAGTTAKALPAIFTKVAAKIATVAAALGSFAPVVGHLIGLAVGWVATKIAKIIPWQKIKKFTNDAKDILLGTGAALVVGGFGGGLGAAITVGVGTGLASKLIGSTPASRAAFGQSVGGFFHALGGATLGAIAAPVLFTLIGFPVVVALILFIINSGAYMVPQASVSGGGFGTGLGGIACTQDRVPTGINYSTNSPIATRALGIMEDIYQGFWCYFNRSASNIPWNGPPRTGFPNDSVQFPKNYPDWFNYVLFAANPNPSESAISNCAYCMFWCTTLVQEAYKSANVAIQDTLWAPTMQEDFNSRLKFLSNDSRFPSKIPDKPTPGNIVPGSVVFFQVPSNEPGFQNIINHVGVVYRVDSNGLVFLQSNAGTKTGTLNYSGGTWSYTSGIIVAGFGLP